LYLFIDSAILEIKKKIAAELINKNGLKDEIVQIN